MTALGMSPGGVGEPVVRSDALSKARGDFPYAADLSVAGMLVGVIVRSPNAHARIRSVDASPAYALPGVRAVVTQLQVAGLGSHGVYRADQPVFAHDVVRYEGEPVAAVAADDEETARRAAAAILVQYEPLEPLLDPERSAAAPPVHPDGNVVRRIRLRHGDPTVSGPSVGGVVVEGSYEIASRPLDVGLAPPAGLAVPVPGGVELYVASVWLQRDRDQVAQCLGLTPDQLRVLPAGAAGAPSGELDVHLPACLLAMRSGRPVRVALSGDEAAFAAARLPGARLRYRHHADRAGHLVKVEARIVLDAGAYASYSATVLAAACAAAAGPYRVPHAAVDGWAVRTTTPPVGLARGGGAALVCPAYEAQMDKLAAALGLDPLEVRRRNALGPQDTLITGQEPTGPVPLVDLLDACAAAPVPGRRRAVDDTRLPGGAGRTAERSAVRRGVGHALGIAPLLAGEGADDHATARVRVDDGVATVSCAAAEVGQGFGTVAQQIVRDVLGVGEVLLGPSDSSAPSAGPAAWSRLSWVAGGAVEAAARAVAQRVCAAVGAAHGLSPELLSLTEGRVRSYDGLVDLPLGAAMAGRVFEETVTFRHQPTEGLDEHGQGGAYAGYAYAAHRAVVDVDVELGLVRVVDLTVAQDVGRVLNPLQLVGCVEGGTAAGVALALSGSGPLGAFDAPPVRIAALVEQPQPGAPFGAKGAWDVPVGPAAAAVLAAVRDATGLDVRRLPIRHADLLPR